MIEHDIQVTVADLVTERPSRARFFERLGIDYCCGGNRPLQEVCREVGLDAATLLGSLYAAEAVTLPNGDQRNGDERNWDDATVEELIDNIVHRHHAYLRKEFPRLSDLAEVVAEVHGDRDQRLPALRGEVDALRREFETHMEKEESESFPAMIRLIQHMPTGGALRGSIGSLLDEHRETAAALRRMRVLTDGYEAPDWACNTFRALYDALRELEADVHQHVHKENNILFPAVSRAIENLGKPADERHEAEAAGH